MLHGLFYQRVGFLYALGNTPASNLVEQLPPGNDLKALLLGCGDPRHILFTSYMVDEPGTYSLLNIFLYLRTEIPIARS